MNTYLHENRCYAYIGEMQRKYYANMEIKMNEENRRIEGGAKSDFICPTHTKIQEV
jgi:hypothetical protein